MKVLVVCQYYKPEPFRISDICEGLVEMGHSVTVVTGTPNYPEGVIYPGYEKGTKADEIINGVTVHRCPLIPRKSGALYRFLNYYSFVFSSEKYLRSLKEDFDVVFVNQLSPVMMAQAALSWAKRKGKRCVLYCLDLWPESLLAGGVRKDSLIYKVFYRVSRRIYQRADHILVTSRGFVPYFEETLGLTGKKLGYLPQYAEDMFGTLPAVTETKNTVDFLFAGNVGSLQSVETIVEAARLLQDDPQIRIHIVGGGISLETCKQQAEGLNNILFHGRRDLSEMPSFYAMADVLLITMGKDPVLSATLPGKVQSYMAAGKAVAGAIDGETARLINEEALCGACCGAENAPALAEIIRQMAGDPGKRQEYGDNARRYYREHFQKTRFLAELERVLEENCV